MANARRDNKVKLLGVVRRNRPALMMSTALQATAVLVLSLPAHAQPAPNAHPLGGSVVAGAAAISRSASNTQIDQSSTRAAINWQSFDVGSRQSVTFHQPSSSAVALNRVIGPDPSRIAGRIDANGQIILINQSGVNFYQGAQVNTAGLIVTTANMTNTSFMAGSTTFDQPGKPNARIDNAGTITVRQAGLAALVAPQVANSGVITAKLGHVVLAGAKTATLDLYGDGLLSLDVTNQVTQAPVGPDGKPVTALVTNTGMIVADGGTVQLTARAADGIVQHLVEAGGTVRAATMGDQTGVVALNGVGGSIVVTGQLAAPGRAPGSKGGDIEVVSDSNVTVASTARIDASGQAGGGNVGIGTTLDRVKGGPSVTPTMVAANTKIAKGATIEANAKQNGKGGRITVLSSLVHGTTVMNGTISAKGGPQGGDGGFVEVSGSTLGLTGTSDESAPAGHVGSLLLDPTNLDIVTTSPAGTNIDGKFSGNTLAFGAADAATTPSTVTAANLQTLGASGDVTVQATGTIDVQNSVTVANGLRLQAGGDLLVDRGVTIQSQANTLELDAGFDFNNSTFDQAGAIQLGTTGSGSAPQLQAVNLTLHAGTSVGINLNDAALTASKVLDISTQSGAVPQAANGVLTAAILQSSAGVPGDTSLISVNNAIGTVGAFTVASGEFALTNNGNPGNLVLAGAIAGRTVTITNANTGTITATGNINAQTTLLLSSGTGGIALSTGHFLAAPTVDLSTAGGGVTQVATGKINTTVLQSSTGLIGTVSLPAIANNIGTLGRFAVTSGDFSLANNGNAANFAILGPVTAGNLTISNANAGTISVTGSIGASTGTVSLSSGSGGIALAGGTVAAATAINLNGANGGIALTGNAALGGAGTVVDLNATAGGVSETANAGVQASTLQSTSGVTGDVSLLGNNNAVASLGKFNGTGNFGLADTAALTVAGALSASGNVYLADSNATGIAIGAAGSVGAGTLASFQADAFVNAGSVTGKTFELAPNATGATLTLGAASPTPALSSLTGIGITNVRLGAVTLFGAATPTVTAGAITITGAFGTPTANIELDATGAISETASGSLAAKSLTGKGGSISLLTAGNTIAALGALSATSGGVAVADSITLAVNGIVGATTNVFLSGPTIAIGAAGAVNAGAANLASFETDVFSNAGAVTGSTFELAPFTNGATVVLGAGGTFSSFAGIAPTNIRIGAVTDPNNGSTTTAGSISVGANFGTPAIALELDSNGAITEAAGAVLTASTLAGKAVTGFDLSTKPNAIGTLGAIHVSAGNFALDDGAVGGNLTVNGPVTGTNVTILNLTNTPTITIAGSVGAGSTVTIDADTGGVVVANGGIVTGPTIHLDGRTGGIALQGTAQVGSVGGTVDLSTTGVGVSEASGAVVTAGTLISASGVTGPFNLSLSSNDIANLGSIKVTGGAFNLNDAGRAGTLGVAGPVTATSVSIVSGAGALTVAGSIGATGTVSLDGANPAAGIVLNGGAAVTGSVIELNGGTIGIVLNDTASLGNAGAVIDLTTTGGGVTELQTAVITGTNLESTGGLVGNVDLLGTANAVAVLNNIAVTGGTSRFAFDDSVVLAMAGTVTAPGQVYVKGQAGINILATSSIGAGTLASFQTDALNNAGNITGATFEYAPATTGSTLSLKSLGSVPNNDRIGAVTLPGAGSPTTTAGSIVVGGNFGGAATNLELDSLGAISESGGAITASSLTGNAGATANLSTANTIATLGSFTVTGGGNLTLNDAGEIGNLTIAGPVSAIGIVITDAGTITAIGGITATNGLILATSGTGGILLNAGAVLTAATVDLDTAGGGVTESSGVINAATLLTSTGVTGNVALSGLNNVATLAGFAVTNGNFLLSDGGSAKGLAVTGPVTASNITIEGELGPLTVSDSIAATGTVTLDGSSPTAGIALNTGAIVTGSTIDLNGGTIGITLNGNALLGKAGAVVDLTTTGNGVIEAATALIIAGTLQSTGGINGIVSLPGASNAIAVVGSVAVTGGTFNLTDTGNLKVVGALTADGVTIADSGALTVSGDLIAAGTASLTAASIDIANVGLVNGGSVALFGTVSAITETGTLIAGTLSGSAVGAANLTGATATTNQIGTLGNFTAAGFTLDDGEALTVSGTVNGGTSATLLDAGLLTVGGTVAASAISLTADNLAITGLVTDGGAGTTTLVATTGTIDETGTLVVGTLSGSAAGAASLAGATTTTNQIAAVGNFTAADVTLDDGTGLTIVGSLSGGSSATVLDKGALTVGAAGTVTASAISLTGDSVTIAGLVTDGGAGTVGLFANVGSIGETGTLIAGTLSGSAKTSASLTGATATTNQVANIGNFTAAGFTLDDGISETVKGALNGGSSVTLLDKGTLLIASGGTVTATAIGLTADNINIAGLATDGGSGTTSLIASTGTIGDIGTLVAGTLTGSAAGAVNLAGATNTANQVATLGTFSASGFTLDDGISLTVAGALSGGSSATLLDQGTLTIAGTGTVAATAIGLTADNIAIAGLLTDGGSGTTNLVATTGTIGETGTLVVGTLSGSSAGATTLAGASATTNQVATIGTFTASGFTLDDGIGVTVAGVLTGGSSVTVLDQGALLIGSGGTVAASAIALTGDSVTIDGLVTDGGAGTVNLIANAGTISEPGTLVAGTLSGSASGSASLLGATATTNAIANIGNFTAAGFTLDDGTNSTVIGVLNGGSSVTMLDNGTLTIASVGTVTASAISLTANNINVVGLSTDGGTGTTSLIATTGTIGETGTLIAGTLGGSSAGATSLTGATATTNQVATLSSFTASGFTLDDGTSLSVTGVLNGGPGATVLDKGTLTIASGGTVAATAIGLTADDITVTALVTDGGAGTTGLVATTGTISEGGTLVVGTLSGSAAGAASLTGATATTNQIANVGNFAATGFTLNDGASLSVNGTLAGGPSTTVLDNGTLTIAAGGTVSATAIGLTANDIAIPGLVTDGGAGTVSLIASTGTVREGGTLIAGTLSGSAAGSASLAGATPTTNRIATLGNFSAAGFGLNDGAALVVTGTLAGGQSATVLDAGILTIAAGGTVAATAIGLTANDISLVGLVTDGGAGTVALVASTGTIGEAGTLIAGTLTGSAATTAALVGAGANQVANLGDFTAIDLTLNDSASLNVKGTVTAGKSATIVDAASLQVSGTIAPPAGANIAVGLTAATIDIPGMVSDGGAGATSLIATAGIIGETGTLIAGTLSGSSPGSTSLTGAVGTATNKVATLGNFSASGFALNDSASLTVTGTVTGGPSVTITDLSNTGFSGITVAGTITGSVIHLCCGNISIPGMVSDGGAGTVVLNATGGINETGTLIAGTLNVTTFLPGATLIGATPTANQIAVLGDSSSSGLVAFSGGPLTLRDGRDLLISGNVTHWTNISINDAGNLTVAGNLSAFGGLALSANSISMLGAVSGNSVLLTATAGAISQSAGALTAGTLTGSAAGAASLTQPVNQIGTVSNFTASGLTLNDAADLTISGSVNGGPNVTLVDSRTITVAAGGTLTGGTLSATANGSFAIAGTVQDAGSVNLISSTAGISETGTLIADLLTGSAATDASLTGAPGSNRVAQLGAFSAGGTLTLNDATDLTIIGPLSAPRIVINSGASKLTLANQAVITTGGVTRPPGFISVYPGDPGSPPANGTFLTTAGGFTQQGSSSIAGLAGGPSVLRINATGDANIAFDPTAGLQGKASTWLILSIETGKASGQVNVKNLDVIRTGNTGSTDLTGSVANLTGPAAAGASGIQPGPNSNFRFNQCPIHSVNCVLLPALGVPVANPLNDIYFGSLFNPNDDEDLLLPIVSDQDY